MFNGILQEICQSETQSERKTEDHCPKKIFQVQILFSDPRLCPVSQSNLFMQTAAGTHNVIVLSLVTGVGVCSCSLETMWAFALTFSIKESLETREIAMNET